MKRHAYGIKIHKEIVVNTDGTGRMRRFNHSAYGCLWQLGHDDGHRVGQYSQAGGRADPDEPGVREHDGCDGLGEHDLHRRLRTALRVAAWCAPLTLLLHYRISDMNKTIPQPTILSIK